MFVVYDLPQALKENQPARLAHSAKEFVVPGTVSKWETGEFEIGDSGRKVSAIRIEYERDTAGNGEHVEYQIIELPTGAQNVRVSDTLPPGYREGLEAAA